MDVDVIMFKWEWHAKHPGHVSLTLFLSMVSYIIYIYFFFFGEEEEEKRRRKKRVKEATTIYRISTVHTQYLYDEESNKNRTSSVM